MYVNFPYNFVNFIAKGRFKLLDFYAVDDFGVEYSSVERLIKTKPEVVKLDGFFLREARSMLKWVVVGMKRLGFKVVVEQVENEKEFEFIKSLKVDMAQGFYLGRPQLL